MVEIKRDSSSEIERERLSDIQIFSSEARNVVRELCIFSRLSSPRTFLSFFRLTSHFILSLSPPLSVVVTLAIRRYSCFSLPVCPVVVLAAVAALGGGIYVFGK